MKKSRTRKYHVIARRPGRKDVLLTSAPVTHDEGCTMMSKFYPRSKGSPKDSRIMLLEIVE